MTDSESAVGWDAIDAALEHVYPGVEPKHYGTMIKWAIGGPDPLDGISVYQRDDHWHLVGFGMSELYEKQSDLAEVSGWGFEFTFRPARPAGEADPPVWALSLLQNLGRYVFSSGNLFAPGHHVDLNGPISMDRPDTAIRAITFAVDPELGTIETPHGTVTFLQVVGLTLDEYAAVELWNADSFVDVLRARNPLLVTDPGRSSITDDPSVAATVDEGTRREGSSTGSLFVDEASWRTERTERAQPSERTERAQPFERTVLRVGALPAERIGLVLANRLAHGRGFVLDGPQGGVRFRPGDGVAVNEDLDGYVVVDVTPDLVNELVGVLRPKAAVHPLASAPGLTIEIVRSQIRDQEGNVVREVG